MKRGKESKISRVENIAVVRLVRPCQEYKTSGTNFRRLDLAPNQIPSLAHVPSAAAVPLGFARTFQAFESLLTCQDVLNIYRKITPYCCLFETTFCRCGN